MRHWPELDDRLGAVFGAQKRIGSITLLRHFNSTCARGPLDNLMRRIVDLDCWCCKRDDDSMCHDVLRYDVQWKAAASLGKLDVVLDWRLPKNPMKHKSPACPLRDPSSSLLSLAYLMRPTS